MVQGESRGSGGGRPLSLSLQSLYFLVCKMKPIVSHLVSTTNIGWRERFHIISHQLMNMIPFPLSTPTTAYSESPSLTWTFVSVLTAGLCSGLLQSIPYIAARARFLKDRSDHVCSCSKYYSDFQLVFSRL